MRSHQTRSARLPSSCQRSPGVPSLPATTWNKKCHPESKDSILLICTPSLLTPSLLTPSLLTPIFLPFTHSLTNTLPSHRHTCPSLLQVLQSVSEFGPASWHRDPSKILSSPSPTFSQQTPVSEWVDVLHLERSTVIGMMYMQWIKGQIRT